MGWKIGEGAGKSPTYVGADDGGDDGSWYDDAPDSETGEDQEAPGSIERIGLQASKSSNALGFSGQLVRSNGRPAPRRNTYPLSL